MYRQTFLVYRSLGLTGGHKSFNKTHNQNIGSAHE